MHISETGFISRAKAGTLRACMSFGTSIVLDDWTLLATARVGDNKDSEHERVEIYRSPDDGKTWGPPATPFGDVVIAGVSGTLKLCYLTELAPGHILGAAMWVDRTSHPGKPLFDAETQGCLPMAILLADSFDQGRTWSEWRNVAMPAAIGPPGLTSPILKLADGSLVMSIETNKHYDDASKWHQRAVFLHSHDNGLNWSEPASVAEDPSGRIFNWDLRCGVGVDGKIATFAWTYDTDTQEYVNIHRRVSTDGGQSWSDPVDLGFADQAGPPVMLPDGRVVLVWVDRFGGQCIRARVAPSIDAPFDPESEVTIYSHAAPKDKKSQDTGHLLVDMEIWAFGLPFATALPDGDVLVTYYAGDASAMSLHFARLVL